MNLLKPKFWDLKKPNLLSYLLIPFTIPIILNNVLINFLKKIKSQKIKSICIGNIYIGGTGKTPTTIKLYDILNNLGFKVCVGKKFYKSQKDEQMLLQKRTKLFLNKNRKKIIDEAINDNNEMIIFDDGLQEKKIDYNLKFVCFDKDNWIGNGLLIPSGPLRENLNSLKKYDAIFIKQIDEKKLDNEIIDKIKEINPQIKIFYSKYIFKNLEDFDPKKKYFVFSGIGSSNSFKELLLKYNFDIIDELHYPDHFNYQQNDLDTIVKKAEINKAKIITTEKDFTKISNLNHKNINFVKLDLKINNEKDLLNFIKSKLYA
tara:strand:- start:907 stop:1857 length:951 start_codon:yes stop_codon:yes gene_type:complete